MSGLVSAQLSTLMAAMIITAPATTAAITLTTYQLVKGAADGVIRLPGICAVITTILGVTGTIAKLL